MFTSDIESKTLAGSLRSGLRYLAASIVIAAAAAVYGLFSHGVYSYYMTYAFMIPLIGGAMPHLISALKISDKRRRFEEAAAADHAEYGECSEDTAFAEIAEDPEYTIVMQTGQNVLSGGDIPTAEEPQSELNRKSVWNKLRMVNTEDMRLAVIATLTAGSLLKGALDIYGTTNQLIIAYPIAALILAALALITARVTPRVTESGTQAA